MQNSKFKIGESVIYNAPTDDATPFIVSKIAINFNAIPKTDIHPYTIDANAYTEAELNRPWYKNASGDFEGWYAEDELMYAN